MDFAYVLFLALSRLTLHYVKLAQGVLYRGADFALVWPHFAAMAVIGLVFLVVALTRFRSMLARQG